MGNFIPVNEPDLTGNEKKYLMECIDSGWISSDGPFVRTFEERFSQRVGRKYGIAVANGSVALDVAIAALGIGPGDEVILPTFTIISCASAIIRAGAIPVVVDSEENTWNMDVTQIESKITTKTRAIMMVHIYGHPVDVDPVLSLAQRYGLFVIEDSAELIGQTYKELPCGSFGKISTFSFYPNKHITTGEGGMVVCDDEELAERCRSLRNLCFQNKKRFVHEELGWNFRMSNLQAAVGIAQLERLDDFILRKRHIGFSYNTLLKDVRGLDQPLVRTSYSENIYWVYGIVLQMDIPLDAEGAMTKLAQKGIGTRPFFFPMHEQPVFQRMGLFKDESYPVAERISRRGLYIPSGLGLTDAQIESVVNEVCNMMASL